MRRMFIYSLVVSGLVTIVEQGCYNVEVSSGAYWIDPKHCSIQFKYYNETFVLLNIDIYTLVKTPTFILEVFTWAPDEGIRVYFNGSYRMCDFRRFATMGPFGATSYTLLKKFSNFTFTCPLQPSMYYARVETNFISRVTPIRLFYRPNRIATIQVTAGEQDPPGNFTKRGFFSVVLNFKKTC
ncbi:uncharacterized protein LOC119656192 [Hermetia illucens]|uniref:uncharacterized protein LOC119656192 n=1 Tax=Hermetia illucens TaxID=343691 RepID=UPI0018CC0293|nr:uncharacterized protein LOC119656192 [Hermetia illucens]